MKAVNVIKTAVWVALLAGAAAAQLKYVAVVETEVDAATVTDADLSYAEAREITAELRREAVKNLPRGKYNIMTSETVQAQGGAVLEECAEENCVITLGSKIGADYIVRGIIRRFRTQLTLTVEIYETEDGNLVASSDPVRSETAAELLAKTAAVCAEMYKAFANSQASAPQKPAPAIYTVTTAVNPAGGGAVSRSPDKEAYAKGETVTLTAAPAGGYTFAGWSGDASGAANTATLTMDDDKTATANFNKVLKQKPKPAAGLAQKPPAGKRHTFAAGLDIIGAGVIAFGYVRDLDVKDKVGAELYADAEKPVGQRNIAYTVGTIILLSGITLHIFF